jgi:hypothetical protein
VVDDAERTTRRRRRRATRSQGAPPPEHVPPEHVPPEPVAQADPPTVDAPQRPRRRKAPRDSAERGLRDIVGAGRSQVGVSGALRARDVNRPTDADLSEAERDVVIVRRNWQPDDQR